MSVRKKLSLLTAFGFIFVSGLVLAGPKIPPKYHATPLEIAYLPKYCYNQYVDGALGGPEFSMPPDLCGYEMNHFCPGLVAMTRAAQLSRPKNERIGYLSAAIENFDYTLRGMKPGCFVAKDVQQAKARARMLSGLIR